MSANLLALFYLISGILFILALRGLSSPETSRQGNLFGILGMAIAIGVTFLSVGNFSTGFLYVLGFLLIGGSAGAFISYKIPMTAMPELVAGFHSLVGLAAVFVAISAFLNPEVFKFRFIRKYKNSKLNRDVFGCINWCYNVYWINNSFFKTSRNYVWFPNHFYRSTLFKSCVRFNFARFNILFM